MYGVPMPDQAGTLDVIGSSLKASLSAGRSSRTSLDEDVAAASKRVLLHNINWVQSSTPYSIERDSLRAKYISLNPTPSQGEQVAKLDKGQG